MYSSILNNPELCTDVKKKNVGTPLPANDLITDKQSLFHNVCIL